MHARRSLPAQALVEAAVVIPILLLVAFTCIGMGRLIQARMGLAAATREAARATALSPMPNFARTDQDEKQDQAITEGENLGREVASDNGLNGAEFQITVANPGFQPSGWVTVVGTYDVKTSDIPFMRELFSAATRGGPITLTVTHIERIDPYRSWGAP